MNDVWSENRTAGMKNMTWRQTLLWIGVVRKRIGIDEVFTLLGYVT